MRLCAALLAVPLFVAPAVAVAADAVTAVGDLTIADPWARASAGMARAGAAFMHITNDGATDRLVAADADVSRVVELHTHIKDGDIMRMRRVDAIEVTGGTETVLQPGGLHVMLIDLHAPLEEGESFPLSLTFETAGTVEVTVTVKGVGASSGGMTHGMTHGQGATN